MNDKEKIALGKRIQEKREKLGISQLELAKSANKHSAAYIAFIEAGDRNVTAMDLMLIAKALGTTVSVLLGEGEKTFDFVQALRSDKDVTANDKRKIEEYYELLKNKNKGNDNN